MLNSITCLSSPFCGDQPCTGRCQREAANFGDTFAVFIFPCTEALVYVLLIGLVCFESAVPDAWQTSAYIQKNLSSKLFVLMLLQVLSECSLPNDSSAFPVLIKTEEGMRWWFLFQFRAVYKDGLTKLDKRYKNETCLFSLDRQLWLHFWSGKDQVIPAQEKWIWE